MGDLYKPNFTKHTGRAGAVACQPFSHLIRAVLVAGVLAVVCGSEAASAANQPPTIGPIADQVVVVDQPTHALHLTLNDPETTALDLVMSAASSDTNVVPVENVFFGIFAPNQYVTVTPAFGQTGSSTITLTVSDGTNTASTSFLFTVNPPPAGTLRFANPTPVIIPLGGPATPYPSVINVSGMSGTITNLALTLSRLSHEYVTDVHMLLVGPTGQKVVVFGSVAQGRAVHNVTVNLVDSSDYPLPQSFSLWPEPLRPTDWAVTNDFPAPAPAGPYAPVAMSSFNGLTANGVWSLYVYDDMAPDQGDISGGWSLLISTTGGSNLAPTIDVVADQATLVNATLPAIPFVVGDSFTPADALNVTAISSNPSLVPTSNIALGGTSSNRTVTITPAANQIGTATITLRVSDGDLTATSSFQVSVSPRPLALNVDSMSREYGSANPEFAPALSGLMPGDDISAGFTSVATPASPIGTYPIVPTLNDPQGRLGNYVITTNLGLLTITPAALTVVADNQSRSYGAANPALTAAIAGIRNNDSITVTCSTSADAHSAVGSYAIVPALSGALENYVVTIGNGSLVVAPAPLTVTAENKSRIYGAANPELAGAISGLLNNDSITASFSTTADTNSPVGSYAIVPSLSGPVENYAVTSVAGSLNVSAAELIVVAADKSRAYGVANPEFTASVTGFVNGEDMQALAGALQLSTPAETNSPVGHYPIVASGLASTNYAVVYSNGTLTITAYQLTIQTDNQSRFYGNTNPVLTGTLAGVPAFDDISASFSTTADVQSGVGSYPILASLIDPGNRLGNYTIITNGGTLSIAPAPLVVTAADKSRSYGTVNPELTALVTGIRNGDSISVSCSTTAEVASPVGSYAIVPSLSGLLDNYAVTANAGVLTVTGAALVVSVDSQSRTYGQANPVLTGAIAGIVNDDPISVNFSTTADAQSSVGSHPIVPQLSGPLSNYSVTTNLGTLAITPATLIVIANDQSRVYGAPNPEFTATIAGFVNGENTSVLSGSPSLYPAVPAADAQASVSPTTPAGVYAIVAAPGNLAAANYTLVFSNGTLTILPADSLLALATAQNPSSAGSNVTFTASLTAAAPAIVIPTGWVQFFANGSPLGAPVAASAGLASISTDALPAGTNLVQAVYSGDGNFNGSSNSVEQMVKIEAQQPSIVGIRTGTDGTVIVTCAGTPGAAYLLQRVRNFGTSGNWMNLSTNIAGEDGQWSYTESMSDGPQCYYRVAIP